MSAPVRHTCPDIDRALEMVKAASDAADNASRELADLIGKHGLLEELRTANASLRHWGESLEEELDEERAKIQRLEERIEQLESELAATKENTHE